MKNKIKVIYTVPVCTRERSVINIYIYLHIFIVYPNIRKTFEQYLIGQDGWRLETESRRTRHKTHLPRSKSKQLYRSGTIRADPSIHTPKKKRSDLQLSKVIEKAYT